MASYFDITTDKYLLHSSVRNHAEVSNMATVKERELIRFYTYRNDAGTLTVGIKGYKADADDVTETGLVTVMKDAIAAMVSDALMEYDTPDGLTSETLGDYTYERESGKVNRGLEKAEAILVDYDCREPTWWV